MPDPLLDTSCPVCSSTDTSEFFELTEMPVLIGVQWRDAESARNAPRGDLKLTFCRGCGFIWNTAFDPALLEYSQAYDNSLHFSGVFQEYTGKLVRRLVETYDVRNKDVIDIGCGKGDFLALLCEEGNNRGVGFDPSFEGERVKSVAADRLTFIDDLFTEKYSDLKADLIVSRYVFEHIQGPSTFLKMLRRAIGDAGDTVVYFEVPNVRLILRDLSVWDIIYEHCSYFSEESLARVFSRVGFKVLRVEESYGGQFLGIEAAPAEISGEDSHGDCDGLDIGRGDLVGLEGAVDGFTENFREQTLLWRERLDNFRRLEQRVVAWGAGAKAVGFLNMMGIGDEVPYVVDINPHKQGLHLAGTGQEIVAPNFLKEYAPNVVILMNPIYRHEIAEQLTALNLSVQFLEASATVDSSPLASEKRPKPPEGILL